MSNEAQPNFEIIRVYTKNISLESPNSPEVFTQEATPEIGVQVSNAAQDLGDNFHEVNLRITVTAKAKIGEEEKTLFLAEVEQSGIFNISGFEADNLAHMRGAFCPNILFPYAREVIDSLVRRAGFPPVILAPIDFNMVYAQNLAQMEQAAAESEEVDA